MKSHELAKRLLAMPDLEVVAGTEDDGYEHIVISEIRLLKNMQYDKRSSWNEVPCYVENGKDEIIELL